jgi:hypothetical protein
MSLSNIRKAAPLLLVLVFWVMTLPAGAHPTLPQAVTTAHSVFLQNQTGFPELEYTALLELNKWGRFDVVASQDKADLVLVLTGGTHVRAIPDGQFPRTTGLNAFTEESVPAGHIKIALVDPKTGATLWSDLHKSEGGKVKSGHLLDGLRQAFDEYEKSRNKR